MDYGQHLREEGWDRVQPAPVLATARHHRTGGSMSPCMRVSKAQYPGVAPGGKDRHADTIVSSHNLPPPGGGVTKVSGKRGRRVTAACRSTWKPRGSVTISPLISARRGPRHHPPAHPPWPLVRGTLEVMVGGRSLLHLLRVTDGMHVGIIVFDSAGRFSQRKDAFSHACDGAIEGVEAHATRDAGLYCIERTECTSTSYVPPASSGGDFQNRMTALTMLREGE